MFPVTYVAASSIFGVKMQALRPPATLAKEDKDVEIESSEQSKRKCAKM